MATEPECRPRDRRLQDPPALAPRGEEKLVQLLELFGLPLTMKASSRASFEG
jgi:hypothetical protein